MFHHKERKQKKTLLDELSMERRTHHINFATYDYTVYILIVMSLFI